MNKLIKVVGQKIQNVVTEHKDVVIVSAGALAMGVIIVYAVRAEGARQFNMLEDRIGYWKVYDGREDEFCDAWMNRREDLLIKKEEGYTNGVSSTI